MINYGQQIINDINKNIIILQNYIIEGYDNEDIKDIILIIANRIEIFIRRDVFPTSSKKDIFYDLLNKLHNNTNLNYFRKNFYNGVKHNPTKSFSPIETIKMLCDLKSEIEDIEKLNLGNVNELIQKESKRIFWISAYDYYIHNETEVYIHLPRSEDLDYEQQLDFFSINCSDWYNFKNDLKINGFCYESENLIPKKHIDNMISEDDALMPFVYEGSYNYLMSCLAKYAKTDERLINGLNRDDNYINILQSLIMIFVDSKTSKEDIIKNIISKNLVSNIKENYLIELADELFSILNELPEKTRNSLTGPYWKKNNSINKSSIVLHNKNLGIIIDNLNRIIFLK